ncbi:MAG: CheY-like chemotaxis protein/anti-sigma regulatory factor (Ser/Thr protein kinase) [bacterium]|jgi:CheY-like chemotaxis protein/anti-sigma regulatory factor (Ser/Thr protein kinase)
MISDLKYRILVVDKDKESKNRLKEIFDDEGYNYEEASSAEKAWKIIRKKHFDLILSDIQLGKKTGIELLKDVRNFYPKLPFIILATEPTVENTIDAINLGVTSYFVKPVESQMLRDAIKRAIRHHKSRFLKNEEINYQMENVFSAVIASNEQAIIKLLDTVDNLIELVYPKEYGAFPDLKMAIYEGLSNAIEHGNQGDITKNIYFSIELKMDRIIVHIKDQGKGFEYKKTLQELSSKSLINRGLSLMKHLMDEISFNLKGNEISLLKLLQY